MSDAVGMSDQWAAGEAYERFMGRWSRLVAPEFVAWLGVGPGARWLDVGCGTGALSRAICLGAGPASVLGCDPSEAFIDHARRDQSDPRLSFAVAAAGDLPADVRGFDSVTSAFALNFFPDPGAGIDDMRRRAKAGGLVSACVWDYAGRMQFLRAFWDAATAVDPRAADVDEARRFPICQPERLLELFRSGGLGDVSCAPLEIPTRFSSFSELWAPFLGGTGPAPSYVAGLPPDQREALADRFARSLPVDADGAISLVARAWAVRGVAS